MTKKYRCIKDFMPSGHDFNHVFISNGTICVNNPHCTLTRKGRIWLDAPNNAFDVTKSELKNFFVPIKEN